MNKFRGLSLFPHRNADSIQRSSERDNRLLDNSPLEAGPPFLPCKAISCKNAYVANVQAVAPRFQGVPEHTEHSTRVQRMQEDILPGGSAASLPMAEARGISPRLVKQEL